MSILSDSKILESIEKGEIVIQPFNTKQLGSNSYDVLLDSVLIIYKNQHLDCKKNNQTESITIPEDGILLEPGRLYLGSVKEFTETKNHVILFEGKSSLARLGLFVHITSGFGDIGYKGYLTVELSVVQPLRIYKDMRIGQIYYQNVDGFCINPYNKKEDAKYNNTNPGPISSKMHLNFIEELDHKEALRNRLKDSGISFIPDDLKD